MEKMYGEGETARYVSSAKEVKSSQPNRLIASEKKKKMFSICAGVYKGVGEALSLSMEKNKMSADNLFFKHCMQQGWFQYARIACKVFNSHC